MNELKKKAEYFQQYILDRFKKLCEQRTVGTNTDAEKSQSKEKNETGVEQVVQDCDDDMTVKVISS